MMEKQTKTNKYKNRNNNRIRISVPQIKGTSLNIEKEFILPFKLWASQMLISFRINTKINLALMLMIWFITFMALVEVFAYQYLNYRNFYYFCCIQQASFYFDRYGCQASIYWLMCIRRQSQIQIKVFSQYCDPNASNKCGNLNQTIIIRELMRTKEISHQDLTRQFKVVREQSNLHLKNFVLMRNLESRRRVFMKKHACSTLQEAQELLADYERLHEMYNGSDNLCKLIGFNTQLEANSPCVNLLYDYHQNTLEQEVAQMTLKGQEFAERELDCLLISCLGALELLERYGMNHLCLKYSNILVEGRNTIDLAYRLLFTPYLTGAVSEIITCRSLVEDYNLSTQQLHLLNSQLNQTEASLSFSQRLRVDKESLGFMVLRLATSSTRGRPYTNQNQSLELQWDPTVFKVRYQSMSRTCSKQFVRKVDYLLFDKGFHSFKNLPHFMMISTSHSTQGSQNRAGGSANKSLQKSRQRCKSPFENDSNKKYNSITSNKFESHLQSNRWNEASHFSNIARVRGSSLGNSKSSVHSFTLSPLGMDSPTRVKRDRYAALKLQLEQIIMPKIENGQMKMTKKQDESEYIGNLKNNKKEGIGICYFKEGDIYAGQWKNDQMEGEGRYLFQNCDIYMGEVQRGLKHGYGKYVYHNGNTYEGEWKNDKKEGYGTFCANDRTQIYEGYWVNGIKSGEGIYKWKNGDRFEGSFAHGSKSGNGLGFKQDGSRIQGHWYNDDLRGIVSIKFRSGATYTGEVTQKPNGKLMADGKGSLITQDGIVYEGWHSSNAKNGNCKISYPNGDWYEGQIQNSKFQGQGSYFYHNSNCTYKGSWKNGLQSGPGQIIFANKTRIQCQWNEGKPCETGTIYYVNGDVYEGQLGRQGRHGNGVYTQRVGSKLTGYFKNGIVLSQS